MFGEKAILCDDVICNVTVRRSEPMRGEQARPTQTCLYRRATISATLIKQATKIRVEAAKNGTQTRG